MAQSSGDHLRPGCFRLHFLSPLASPGYCMVFHHLILPQYSSSSPFWLLLTLRMPYGFADVKNQLRCFLRTIAQRIGNQENNLGPYSAALRNKCGHGRGPRHLLNNSPYSLLSICDPHPGFISLKISCIPVGSFLYDCNSELVPNQFARTSWPRPTPAPTC